MDSSQMPEIKPDIYKEEKGKKGWLASLLSRLGMGGSAGAEGASLGGIEGLGGAGLGGGILATKAGIIGLIVAGTTVAGGIGLVGYKVFGPSSADRAGVGYSSLFEARPKEAQQAGAEGQGGAASNDGKSASLQYLVDANAGSGGAQKKTEAAEDLAAAAKAQSASAGAPHDNNAAPGGQASSLKPGKFGSLSGLTAGAGAGGAGSGASAGAAPAISRNLMASAKPLGAAGGFAAGKNLKGIQGSGVGRGAGRVVGQLKAVYGDQYSASPGRTYDGGRTNAISGAQGLSLGSLGENRGKSDAKPTINPSGNSNRFPEVASTEVEEVTPWKKAIKMATYSILGALVLLMLANKMLVAKHPVSHVLVHIVCAVAACLGLFAIALGAMIGGGEYGQHTQGAIFTLCGGLVTAAAISMMAGMPDKKGAAVSGTPQVLMYLCGGLALVGLIAGYMTKPKTYSSSLFENGKPPDEHIMKSTMPSQDTLIAFHGDLGGDFHA